MPQEGTFSDEFGCTPEEVANKIAAMPKSEIADFLRHLGRRCALKEELSDLCIHLETAADEADSP